MSTNAEFALDRLFRKACELAKVEPTKRQASKWRNRRGRAYTQRHAAEAQIKEVS